MRLAKAKPKQQRLAVAQGSIVQALESDFGKVQELVEEAVRQLSSRGGASSVAPLDACGIMEVMNESHVSQLLPRCAEGDAVLERFRQHCLDCKVRQLPIRGIVNPECLEKQKTLNPPSR